MALSGLDPREEYCVLLEMSLVGRRRWRWAGGAWAAAGGAEPQSPRRLMLHPDSPAPGHHWTANPVSFSKLKLTNNTMDALGHVSWFFIRVPKSVALVCTYINEGARSFKKNCSQK